MATQAPSLQPQELDTYKIVNVIRWILAQLTGASSSSGAASSGGRLTLSTGTPVMTATVSGATTVYYTPYIHQSVALYNGTGFTMTDIGGELSQTTTDTTKSPAAVGASLNYDMFVWADGTTFRCTRGPPWTTGGGSAIVRGTGAGSTALTRVNGILLNANDITNGPLASRGTYVGTIRSNASSTIDFIYGGAASGGTAAVLNVWNMYNRVQIGTQVVDNATFYTYTSATVRQARGSAGNQVTFLMGLQEDSASIVYMVALETSGAASAQMEASVGIDTTTAFSTASYIGFSASAVVGLGSGGIPYVFSGLGSHFLAALEKSDGINANFFNIRTGTLNFQFRM